MENTSIMKSEIFFFIASISLTLLTILISIFIIYMIFVIRRLNNSIERFTQKTEEIFVTISDYKDDVLNNPVINFVDKIVRYKGRRR